MALCSSELSTLSAVTASYSTPHFEEVSTSSLPSRKGQWDNKQETIVGAVCSGNLRDYPREQKDLHQAPKAGKNYDTFINSPDVIPGLYISPRKPS